MRAVTRLPEPDAPQEAAATAVPAVGAPSPAYARYVLAILVIVYVFNFIDRNILSILAEDIKADLGIGDAEMGFLYGTVFAVFYAVFGIPLARFADVWVRRSLISLGLLFWSLMTALSGLARSFPALATYRIGVGIGEASASPAAFSMLSDYYPPRLRATVLAIYSSGVYIGGGIAPKLLEKIKAGPFMEAFLAKGRLTDILRQLPVKVILNDKTGLLGAAYWGAHLYRTE